MKPIYISAVVIAVLLMIAGVWYPSIKQEIKEREAVRQARLMVVWNRVEPWSEIPLSDSYDIRRENSHRLFELSTTADNAAIGLYFNDAHVLKQISSAALNASLVIDGEPKSDEEWVELVRKVKDSEDKLIAARNELARITLRWR